MRLAGRSALSPLPTSPWGKREVLVGGDDDFLSAAVAVAVADVYPRGFEDELVVREMVADVHVGLGHEVARDTDIGGFASLVLTAWNSAYEGIDTGMTVTAGDSDGTSEVLTEGFEDMLTQKVKAVDDLLRGMIGETVLICRGRASELCEGKVGS